MCLLNPGHRLHKPLYDLSPVAFTSQQRGKGASTSSLRGPTPLIPLMGHGAHRLPCRGIPLAPAHHAKGAISQLLKEAQVLFPNEAGEALQGPLAHWTPRGGRGFPEGALRVMRGKLSLQPLSTEYLFEGSQEQDGTQGPRGCHLVLLF